MFQDGPTAAKNLNSIGFVIGGSAIAMARSRKMSSALGTCRAHFLFSQEIARAADVKEKTAEAAEMGAAARPPCRGGGVLRRADSAEDRLNREGYP